MDLTSLISQLVDAGIGDVATIVIVVLYIRYSSSETRREISKEIDDKIGALKTDLNESIKENRQAIVTLRSDTRQEFNAVRTYAEQSNKEIRQEIKVFRIDSEQSHQETRQDMKDLMLHVIDVRERLANIEGRLGAPTPRMSAVSPPLESPVEEPSAQSSR